MPFQSKAQRDYLYSMHYSDYSVTQPKVSQMNAREFIDLVDKLIELRVTMNMLDLSNHQQDRIHCRMDEEAEVVKRQLTDYLLAADRRKGLYAKGEGE